MKISDIPDQEIIDACDAFHANKGPTPDESLAHKYPLKLILAKMRKMVDKGQLEYGVSLRTAWVYRYTKAEKPFSKGMQETK